jgi:lysozyme family protein
LFDMSVSLGITGASVVLQRAIMCATKSFLKDDGILGPLSMNALGECFNIGLFMNLVAAMRSECAGYYRCLNSSLRNKYLDGWLRRAYDMQ